MRASGFDGRIVLVGEEDELPYERPPLSKAVPGGRRARVEKAFVSRPGLVRPTARSSCAWAARPTGLDAGARTITLDDGEELGYDKLLLATGSRVRAGSTCRAPGWRACTTCARWRSPCGCATAWSTGPRWSIVGAGWVGLGDRLRRAPNAAAGSPIVEPRPTPLHGVAGS